jgi:hypothetical protein
MGLCDNKVVEAVVIEDGTDGKKELFRKINGRWRSFCTITNCWYCEWDLGEGFNL